MDLHVPVLTTETAPTGPGDVSVRLREVFVGAAAAVTVCTSHYAGRSHPCTLDGWADTLVRYRKVGTSEPALR